MFRVIQSSASQKSMLENVIRTFIKPPSVIEKARKVIGSDSQASLVHVASRQLFSRRNIVLTLRVVCS